MPQLHELLAVEGDLKSKAQKIHTKTVNLFTAGQTRFVGRVIMYQVDEGEDPRPPEITELSTTVPTELDRFDHSFSQWLDVAIQKEVTNQETMAVVAVDGDNIFGSGLPATALLNLEAKLAQIREVYEAIPTNDPSERWEWDDGNGHYKSTDRITNITKKVTKALVLYEATENHPAQTQAYNDDVKTGTRSTTLYSGLLSPSEKRRILEKIDKLTRAVKEARQRANNTEITTINISEAIFNYIRE